MSRRPTPGQQPPLRNPTTPPPLGACTAAHKRLAQTQRREHVREVLLAILVAVVLIAALSACDSETMETAPADYERAKADCAPHGGLQSVTTVLVLFRPDRVDARCMSGVRISRDRGTGAQP